jgi:hypothetical protein
MRRNAPLSFEYGKRQRYAYLPTVSFLVVLFLILLVDPSLLWANRVNAQARVVALAIDGAMALVLAGAVVLRWTEPYRFDAESEVLLGYRMIGPIIRVPYNSISSVTERPRTFMRSQAELEISIEGMRGRMRIRDSLKGYPRFAKLLRRRVSRQVRAGWQETARG